MHTVRTNSVSPIQAKERSRETVLKMLPEDLSKVQYIVLEEKAKKLGMSVRTLRRHLDILEHEGKVERTVDAKARPPRVLYQLLTPQIPRRDSGSIPLSWAELGPWVAKISKIKNIRLREEALRALIEIQASLLMMDLLRVWHRGIAARGRKQARLFNKVMLESYLKPTMHDFGFLCESYGDVAYRTVDRLVKVYTQQFNEANSRMIPILWAAAEKKSS
jgi:DNA-binding transcriptional ArsR family regulator